MPLRLLLFRSRAKKTRKVTGPAIGTADASKELNDFSLLLRRNRSAPNRVLFRLAPESMHVNVNMRT